MLLLGMAMVLRAVSLVLVQKTGAGGGGAGAMNAGAGARCWCWCWCWSQNAGKNVNAGAAGARRAQVLTWMLRAAHCWCLHGAEMLVLVLVVLRAIQTLVPILLRENTGAGAW